MLKPLPLCYWVHAESTVYCTLLGSMVAHQYAQLNAIIHIRVPRTTVPRYSFFGGTCFWLWPKRWQFGLANDEVNNHVILLRDYRHGDEGKVKEGSLGRCVAKEARQKEYCQVHRHLHHCPVYPSPASQLGSGAARVFVSQISTLRNPKQPNNGNISSSCRCRRCKAGGSEGQATRQDPSPNPASSVATVHGGGRRPSARYPQIISTLAPSCVQCRQ